MDDRNLSLEIVRVTEAAALSSAHDVGRGDGEHADRMAVQAMRRAFDSLPIQGTVVIGEGERDAAPMLYIGEQVGSRWNHSDDSNVRVDIAVDPLEGTNLCSTGGPGAIAVVALANDGQFLNAPDTYMDKIVVGPEAHGVIDIRESPTWNLTQIAKAKHCRIRDLMVAILDRDRHEQLIGEVRESGARIMLISDGDVSASIATCRPNSDVDVLFGIGGSPEGVLSASALRTVRGDMQGQLKFRDDEEKKRAKTMGINDLEKIYQLEDLAAGDVIFAATGVTTGAFLEGVQMFGGGARTQSVVMRSNSGTVRTIDTVHQFQSKPNREWFAEEILNRSG